MGQSSYVAVQGNANRQHVYRVEKFGFQVKLQYRPKEARKINRAGIWPRHKSSHGGIAQAAMVIEGVQKAAKQQEKAGETLGGKVQASEDEQFTGP